MFKALIADGKDIRFADGHLSGIRVGTCDVNVVFKDSKDYATLFAASPKLLEALQNLLPMWESGIKEPWVEKARAAIAAATGEEQ